MGVGRADCGDGRQKRDEDDDEPGDKGGFSRGGASEAGCLELVAGGEKEADDPAGNEGSGCDGAEVTPVDYGKRYGGERHAEEIEQQGRGVAEGIFDQDEGCSPYGDNAEEQ